MHMKQAHANNEERKIPGIYRPLYHNGSVLLFFDKKK